MNYIWVNRTLTTGILTLFFGTTSVADSNNEFKESFELVWNTINERFYDAGFNGVDWIDSKKRFGPLVSGAENEDAFHVQINTMLFELGVSHLGVVPSDDPEQLGEAAIFGEGTVGIEVRFLNESLLITHVAESSSAKKHGLSPGNEILSLNGQTINEIKKERLEFKTPPFTERNERYNVLQEVYWELMGPVEDKVLVGYMDNNGQAREALLDRQKKSASVVFDEGLPPTYVTFEARHLSDKVGYLRFNSFHPELLDDLADAMERFADTEGLIIDLRGNPGGAFGVRHQLASRFVTERSVIWNYRGRGGIDRIYLEPTEWPYTGNLVIIVDGFCASSSEEFSGGLQFMGRATIVGEQTPGRDLVSDITVLPTGSYFVFPVAETRTVDGTVLEHRGIIPDVEVTFTEEDLKAGRDTQLETALEVLAATDTLDRHAPPV